MIRIVNLAVCAGVLLCACQPVEDRSDSLFRSGRQAVLDADYAAAARDLDAYLEAAPDGQFASRAGLFLGKAWLGQGDLDRARQAFTRTAERYPDSLEAGKCRYKLALIELWTGARDAALRGFAAVARESGALRAEAQAMHDHLVK